MSPDSDLSGIDRLALHYNGKPYANRQRPRVNAWFDIDSYHVWGLR
jgi:hypothetical protein